ncbi:MAG: portal protein [Chloroflexi bacterium HGW-Chloroflexi-1]|nr:MAG: portal protein [Chloroflexi bacterium HGW-Chloroflexi-1]
MKVIVVGCGRVGGELAYRLFRKGYQVTVVDPDAAILRNLPPDFRGRTMQGDPLNQDVLRHAGIEQADALAAVMPSDSINAVVAHIAGVVYRVPTIVVRNYEVRHRSLHETFGTQVVSPSGWGAQRIEEMLSGPTLHTVFSAGNGEVEIYEVLAPEAWAGRTVETLAPGDQCRVVTITRAGRAILPPPAAQIEAGDVLHLSATREGIEVVRRQLKKTREA